MKRKISTICGSLRCVPKEHWDKLAKDLTLAGDLVFTVNVWDMYEFLHSEQGVPTKHLLDKIHKQKIALSDNVHVLHTQDNYLGSSTSSEIDFAESLDIPVHYHCVTVDCAALRREE